MSPREWENISYALSSPEGICQVIQIQHTFECTLLGLYVIMFYQTTWITHVPNIIVKWNKDEKCVRKKINIINWIKKTKLILLLKWS